MNNFEFLRESSRSKKVAHNTSWSNQIAFLIFLVIDKNLREKK